MARLIKTYLRLLEKHPWKTHSITTGVILAGGDVLCQFAVEKKTTKSFDLMRTARFSAVGFCYVGPGLRGWYMILERLYGAKGKFVGLQKMVTDQIVFAPVFLLGILSINCFLRDKSLEAVKKHLERDYVDVLKTNVMVWPGAQLITFYVIPYHLRVLFVNGIALLFNTYISWKSNQ